jgi:lactate permease
VPSSNDANTEPRDLPSTGPDVSVTRAVLPYAILVGLLIATRAQSLAIGDALRSVSLGWDDVFSTGIRAQLQPLHSPGAIFVAVTLFVPALFGRSTTSLGRSARVAWGKLSRATVPLLAAIVTVRVFVHSGDNAAGLEAMPMVLAGVGAETAGPVWPVLAPWVGALGSFIAGSATFSNMLFAGLQQSVASLHGHAPIDVLALQGMGAAAGNMICIHNVVAASTVVGLSRAEGDVIRRTAPAMIVYLSLASLLGWLSAP